MNVRYGNPLCLGVTSVHMDYRACVCTRAHIDLYNLHKFSREQSRTLTLSFPPLISSLLITINPSRNSNEFFGCPDIINYCLNQRRPRFSTINLLTFELYFVNVNKKVLNFVYATSINSEARRIIIDIITKYWRHLGLSLWHRNT